MWKWEAEGQPKAVVVIFHSAYEHHRWYAWLIEKFRNAGFHVVMGDLPGHGDGGKHNRCHDEDFERYYTYGKQLISIAFTYNLPVFVLGNGLGATIAMRVIHRNKFECAGLILTSPWLHLKMQPGKLSNALTSLSALTSSVKLNHDLTLNHLSRNSEVYGEMKDDVPFNTIVTVKWYRELGLLMKMLRDPEVKLLEVPTLVMTGGRDKLTDISAAKQWLVGQNFKNFQYREWGDCLHSLFFEIERDEIFMLTNDFMRNVLRSIGYIID